jgi:hypothetical protein
MLALGSPKDLLVWGRLLVRSAVAHSFRNERSIRRRSRAAPRPRGLPDKSAKRSIEMRLIRETAFNRDLRKRQVRRQDQALGARNSPAHHIGLRGFIEAFAKRPAEVTCSKLGQHR